MALGPNSRLGMRTQQMSHDEAYAAGIDEGLRAYMLKVYNKISTARMQIPILASACVQ